MLNIILSAIKEVIFMINNNIGIETITMLATKYNIEMLS